MNKLEHKNSLFNHHRMVLFVLLTLVGVIFSLLFVAQTQAKPADEPNKGVDLTTNSAKKSVCLAANGTFSNGQCTFTEPYADLKAETDKHLFYRGMSECFKESLHNGSYSKSEISSGKWDPEQSGDAALGYTVYDYSLDQDDKDGRQDCDDGNYITEGAKILGFSDPTDLLCEMHETTNGQLIIDPNNNSDCESSDSFTIYRSCTGVTQKGGCSGIALKDYFDDIFREAVKSRNSPDPAFNINEVKVYGETRDNEAYYVLMRRSLEVFCGKDQAFINTAGDFDNTKDYVSVTGVNITTGDIYGKDKLYHLGFDGRDESSGVKSVYYSTTTSDSTGNEVTCARMAQHTRDNATEFSNYINDRNKDTVTAQAKAGFFTGDDAALFQAVCKKQKINPSSATCRRIVSAQVIVAADNCRNDARLSSFDGIEAKTEKMKQCLKEKLPKAYHNAINGIASPITDDGTNGNNNNGAATNGCAVEGIGWLVCPVLKFMGQLNDSAFGVVSGFLEVEPELLQDSGTATAWQSFRDIANVAFVIAFLIIIYAQITGTGVSNYGIKKLLPKIIISAILVNASYILCQVAVDISNIVGNSVYAFFNDIPTTSGSTRTSGGWETTIGTALAAGAALIAAVLLASVLGTAALLAFAMAIIILLARKAILILLIVISPLAFVAYLLPNTEDWFKKWWKMFYTFLAIFPVVGLIFGASSLAARIINDAASGDVMLQLTALGIIAVPLFAIPVVLKGALSAAGSIGQRLSGLQDRANKATIGQGKKKFDDNSYVQHRKQKKARDNAAIGAGKYNGSKRHFIKNARSGLSKRITDRSKGEYKEYREASASSVGDQLWDEDIKRNKTAVESSGATTQELLSTLEGPNNLSTERRAAMAGIVAKNGTAAQRRALIDHVAANQGNEGYSHIQKQIAHDIGSNLPADLGETASGLLASGQLGTTAGTTSLEAMSLGKLADGKFSGDGLASASGADAEGIANAVTSSGADPVQLEILKNSIRERLANPTKAQPSEEVNRQLQKILNHGRSENNAATHAEALKENQSRGAGSP